MNKFISNCNLQNVSFFFTIAQCMLISKNTNLTSKSPCYFCLRCKTCNKIKDETSFAIQFRNKLLVHQNDSNLYQQVELIKLMYFITRMRLFCIKFALENQFGVLLTGLYCVFYFLFYDLFVVTKLGSEWRLCVYTQ